MKNEYIFLTVLSSPPKIKDDSEKNHNLNGRQPTFSKLCKTEVEIKYNKKKKSRKLPASNSLRYGLF